MTTRFRVNSPNVIHETIEGEVILIDLKTGTYYSLRDSGAAIWQSIEQGAGEDDIEAEPMARPSDNGAARLPFAAPVLEKHTDMQDLILLDPVHEVGAEGWPHPAPPDEATA